MLIHWVHPLGARGGADKIAAKETYKTTIRLNDVVGTELFYVIASVQNFNFEDVRPAFDKVRVDRRGPDMRLDVKLPPYMISRYQFCMHDR